MFEENKKPPAVRVVFVLQRAKNRGVQLKDGGRTPDAAASKIFTENGETKVGTIRGRSVQGAGFKLCVRNGFYAVPQRLGSERA